MTAKDYKYSGVYTISKGPVHHDSLGKVKWSRHDQEFAFIQDTEKYLLQSDLEYIIECMKELDASKLGVAKEQSE